MDVYLDYAANTPIDPAVLQTMYDFKNSSFGNPSSPHRFGQKVKYAVENARDIIARCLKCHPSEIIFTSGGTESNNLALIGAARMFPKGKNHLIVSAAEHPSVINAAKYLQSIGLEVTFVKPDNSGQITVSLIKEHLKAQTAMISAMYVNNETGIINPVRDISEFCKKNDILFHCDAVQAFGKIPFDLNSLKADLLSLSAHKIYGPEGIGAIFIRKGTSIDAVQKGGGQEVNMRAGTENIMGIIGLGKAVELFKIDKYKEHTIKIQRYFEENLKRTLKDIYIIAEKTERSPYISNIAFIGVDNAAMLLNLDLEGIAASTGSACSSGSVTKSRVLQSMGLPDEIVNSAIRFSFGKQTTINEIDYTLQKITDIIKRLL